MARIGGDEFAVLVSGCEELSDEKLGDMLHSAISSASFVVGAAEQAPIGGSVGVARLGPEMDADALMRAADAALYEAKDLAGKGTAARVA